MGYFVKQTHHKIILIQILQHSISSITILFYTLQYNPIRYATMMNSTMKTLFFFFLVTLALAVTQTTGTEHVRGVRHLKSDNGAEGSVRDLQSKKKSEKKEKAEGDKKKKSGDKKKSEKAKSDKKEKSADKAPKSDKAKSDKKEKSADKKDKAKSDKKGPKSGDKKKSDKAKSDKKEKSAKKEAPPPPPAP